MDITMNRGALRYNTKPCKGCGTITSVIAAPAGVGYISEWGVCLDYTANLVVPCRGCGRRLYGRPVLGKVSNTHECNAKCMASHGPACECSCGGKNHGASYAA